MISGSDLRIDATENSFACSNRCGSDLPRPILISVATKENGPPAAVVAAAIFRVRFYSSLPQRRMVPPAVVVAATRSASVLFFVVAKKNGFACRPPLNNGCIDS